MAKNACKDCGEWIYDILKFLVVLVMYKTRVLPSVHIDQLYLPALNSTENLSQTIYINLRLKNRNHATGVHYNDPIYINITFFPKSQNTSIPLGEYGIPGFYQGKGKAKRVMGPAVTRGIPMEGGVPGTQRVGIFRVDFSAKVRHAIDGEDPGTEMLLSANVEFNGTIGNKFENKGIRLVKSGAWHHKQLPIIILPIFILYTLIII